MSAKVASTRSFTFLDLINITPNMAAFGVIFVWIVRLAWFVTHDEYRPPQVEADECYLW
ncbi:hypothetical protein Mapa_006423 [Marchantia paleacea]|nr:hypothetical protein Mapa_006423 [Marchantia paleacea]